MGRKLKGYSAGTRQRRGGLMPSCRVRVYERPDYPPGVFFMTRAWVRTSSGKRPVEIPLPEGMTWEAAKLLADQTASERRKQILLGRTKWGEERQITVRELLEAYHTSAVAKKWTPKHATDKRVSRDFWLGVLNAGMRWEELTPALVSRKAAEEREQRGLSTRTEAKRLEYLRAASRWAYRKARKISEDPLRGIEMPDYEPDNSRLVYSLAEARLLRQPHPEVDWRATLACNITLDVGRRLRAIRHLSIFGEVFLQSQSSAELVELSETEAEGPVLEFARRMRAELQEPDPEARGRVVLHFSMDTDKGKRGRFVPVSVPTGLLIADALERTEVWSSGYLLPGGRLAYADEPQGPIGTKSIEDALHQAEKVFGVPWVRGRAFHGLKRLHVTLSWELSGGDAALVGDVTGNRDSQLLQHIYRQLNQQRIADQVDAVRGAIDGIDD